MAYYLWRNYSDGKRREKGTGYPLLIKKSKLNSDENGKHFQNVARRFEALHNTATHIHTRRKLVPVNAFPKERRDPEDL